MLNDSVSRRFAPLIIALQSRIAVPFGSGLVVALACPVVCHGGKAKWPMLYLVRYLAKNPASTTRVVPVM
jgi:hypothetical protein